MAVPEDEGSAVVGARLAHRPPAGLDLAQADGPRSVARFQPARDTAPIPDPAKAA